MEKEQNGSGLGQSFSTWSCSDFHQYFTSADVSKLLWDIFEHFLQKIFGALKKRIRIGHFVRELTKAQYPRKCRFDAKWQTLDRPFPRVCLSSEEEEFYSMFWQNQGINYGYYCQKLDAGMAAPKILYCKKIIVLQKFTRKFCNSEKKIWLFKFPECVHLHWLCLYKIG